MTSFDDLEKRLREAAAAPEMKKRVEDADRRPPSEEELAAYYAGTLPPAEAERVARRAALSAEASRYLAELDEDVRMAGQEMRAEDDVWIRVKERFGGAWEAVTAPSPALRRVGVAAALVLAVGVASVMMTRGPRYPGEAYVVQEMTPKSSVALPGGRIETNVDASWNLFRPRGTTDRADWFVWQPVQGAVLYSLELMSPDGATLFERENLRGNSFKLPGDIVKGLSSGNTYTWIVKSEGKLGQPLITGVQTFVVQPR